MNSMDDRIAGKATPGSASGDLPRSALASLTRRQLQVLALMAKGHNNAAIAGRLVLEEKSVENHINGIFTQLRLKGDPAAHRRVKAVLLYLEEHRSFERSAA
jgi:DNA-binding NarL/FixJ family response regulator